MSIYSRIKEKINNHYRRSLYPLNRLKWFIYYLYRRLFSNKKLSDKKVALILNGHIRQTFDSNRLYKFIESLEREFNLDIYLHTWNESEAKKSWRELNRDNVRVIDKEEILNYFGKFSKYIKQIKIEDDSDLNLKTEDGLYVSSSMPLRSWKYIWHGRLEAMKMAFNQKEKYDITITSRIDNFNCIQSIDNGVDELGILSSVIRLLGEGDISGVHFIRNKVCYGIDNAYIGDLDSITSMTKYIANNADFMNDRWNDIKNQEYTVFLEASGNNFYK